MTESEPEVVNVFKICVARRPEQVFQDMFGHHPSFAIQDYADSDLEKHLHKRRDGRPSEEEIAGQRRHELTRMYDYIVKNAHTVFLWEGCVATETCTGLESGETFARL